MSAVEETSEARSEFPMPWVLNESPGWKAQWEKMCDEIDQLRKQVEYLVIERDVALGHVEFLCQAAITTDEERDDEIAGLRSALEFYADPETYFAVAFLFDPPCGGFEDDFSEVDHPHFDLWPGKLARAALRGEHEPHAEEIETPESWKSLAVEFLRQAAILENDSHFDDHLIEFRDDGWTVQHPVAERIDGSLFDCDYANWDAGDIGYRGRYVLYMDEEGQLNIGAEVTP